MMTAQEVFTKVATHLLVQNEKSVTRGACGYRGDGGLKCAVGCLISDEDYSPQMEGLDARQLIHRFELVPSIQELSPHEDLIKNLQVIHDRNHSIMWRNKLEDVALRFGPTMPNIDTQEYK